MINWFKEIVECKKCIFSEDGQRVDFCDTHALTPENLEHYLSLNQKENNLKHEGKKESLIVSKQSEVIEK